MKIQTFEQWLTVSGWEKDGNLYWRGIVKKSLVELQMMYREEQRKAMELTPITELL